MNYKSKGKRVKGKEEGGGVGLTKRQQKREEIAQICDQIANGQSQEARLLRACNRKIDKNKGRGENAV